MALISSQLPVAGSSEVGGQISIIRSDSWESVKLLGLGPWRVQMVAVVFPFIFIDLGDTSTVLLHGYNA